MSLRKSSGVRNLAIVLAAGLMIGYALNGSAQATLPANHVGVSASTLEFMTVQTNAGTSSAPVTLLEGTMRLSNRIDLVLDVSAECALWTDVKTVNVGTSEDTSQAIATVEVWVEVDGAPVPVTNSAAAGGPDNGRTVFCNRDHKLHTVFTNANNDDELTIEDFIHSREASAFNWVALNVPSGVHEIKVKGILTAQVTTPNGVAKAAVGKRTLVVDPVHLAPDASF